MVVLTVGVQPAGGAERRIGGGRAGVAQSRGGGDQHDRRQRRETDLLAERDEDDSDYRYRSKGGADAHRNEKPDEEDHNGRYHPAAAHDRDRASDQGFHRSRILQHLRVAAGDQYHKGGEAHEPDAFRHLLVHVFQLDRAGDEDHQQRAKLGKRQGLVFELQEDQNCDGHQRPPMSVVHLQIGFRFLHKAYILIFPRFTIAEEYGDQQADEHRQSEYPVDGGDLVDGNGHSVVRHVVSDDPHKYQARADGDGDIGSFEPEGGAAGYRAAVDLQPVHEPQERRYEDRDIGDVYQYEILGGDRDQREDNDQDIFFVPDGGGHLA